MHKTVGYIIFILYIYIDMFINYLVKQMANFLQVTDDQKDFIFLVHISLVMGWPDHFDRDRVLGVS